METMPSEARERELNVKVYHQADRVNLYDYGYEKSGSVKGDPDVTHLISIGSSTAISLKNLTKASPMKKRKSALNRSSNSRKI